MVVDSDVVVSTCVVGADVVGVATDVVDGMVGV